MGKTFRLFYALWPDEATQKALSVWQACMTGRKVPPENLHITLAFLGERPACIVPELSRILDSLSFPAPRLKLDKTGYFAHSRICWAGMKNPPPGLMQLHEKLVAALSEKSIFPDRKNHFRPHITLARHADRAETANLKPVIWDADRLVLAESRFGTDKKGKPPQYIPIAIKTLDSRKT